MIIAAATVKLYMPWVHSLKEKRMTVKSIIMKTRNKYNVSIVETDEPDRRQTIVLGIACVANSLVYANSVLDKVITFIENNTQAEIFDIHREIR